MTHTAAPLKLAIAGLGTVGAATVALLQRHEKMLAERAGRPLTVVAVSARDRTRDRGVDLGAYTWYDDPVAMAEQTDADVVVELIGGAEGVARQVCETALGRGRAVVTANKALLALHGADLAAAAGTVPLAYEAAVAGGIPAIKGLREGLAANRVTEVRGILNGTCNFILSTMRESGRDFADVLAEAQALGYAEADPAFDVDGVDAAHKLAILVGLAFGTPLEFDSLAVAGIRPVTALDIRYAERLGYRIKLLGTARQAADGTVDARVAPALVPLHSALAHVEGVTNAVAVTGDAVGDTLFVGPGAGGDPTASAVVADLVDVARGGVPPVFNRPADRLTPAVLTPPEARHGAAYMRLQVADRAGVFAGIADVLRDEDISIESVLQDGRNPGETVPVVMTLHDAPRAALERMVAKVAALADVAAPPLVMTIEPH